MKLKGIKADNYRLTNDGKLVKLKPRLSVSEQRRQRSSKRIRVAK